MRTSLTELLCVKEITGVYTVTHAARKSICMKDRPWYGISLAIDGEIVYKHNGESYVSDENHVVILPKGQSYELECVRSGRFTLVNFLLSDDIPLDSFRVFSIRKPDKFLALHKKTEDAFSSIEDSRYARALACFYESLALVIDEAERESVPFVLKQALQAIETRIADSALSNTSLARELRISEVYLRKLFSAYLSTSPKRYILNVRMNRAQDLLIGSDLSVFAIAEQCGYSGVGIFCRAFKAKNGVTPSEYRRENRHRIL